METNPYDQENLPWNTQYLTQEQTSEYREEVPFAPEALGQYQKIQPQLRMPKEQMVTLIRHMKQSILLISVVGFAGLGWLIAAQHAITHPSPQPMRAMPNELPSDDGGNFFKQHDRTQFGRHHHRDDDQGQYSQDQDPGPVSGTHVS